MTQTLDTRHGFHGSQAKSGEKIDQQMVHRLTRWEIPVMRSALRGRLGTTCVITDLVQTRSWLSCGGDNFASMLAVGAATLGQKEWSLDLPSLLHFHDCSGQSVCLRLVDGGDGKHDF